jgi:hypothetical protein
MFCLVYFERLFLYSLVDSSFCFCILQYPHIYLCFIPILLAFEGWDSWEICKYRALAWGVFLSSFNRGVYSHS